MRPAERLRQCRATRKQGVEMVRRSDAAQIKRIAIAGKINPAVEGECPGITAVPSQPHCEGCEVLIAAYRVSQRAHRSTKLGLQRGLGLSHFPALAFFR